MALTDDELKLIGSLMAKCDSPERQQIATALMMKEAEAHGVPWVMHTLDNPDGRPAAALFAAVNLATIAKLGAFADGLPGPGKSNPLTN